ALTWTAGPDGTESYVLIVEDPILERNFVVLHWLVYDIPASVTSLSEAIPAGATIAGVEGAMQAPNIAGSPGYAGPRPPAGETHSYHFQVFALDTTLALPEGATLDAVLEGMDGHVLAWGELVAPYTGPEAAPAAQ